jgi:hypothetical protein
MIGLHTAMRCLNKFIATYEDITSTDNYSNTVSKTFLFNAILSNYWKNKPPVQKFSTIGPLRFIALYGPWGHIQKHAYNINYL